MGRPQWSVSHRPRDTRPNERVGERSRVPPPWVTETYPSLVPKGPAGCTRGQRVEEVLGQVGGCVWSKGSPLLGSHRWREAPPPSQTCLFPNKVFALQQSTCQVLWETVALPDGRPTARWLPSPPRGSQTHTVECKEQRECCGARHGGSGGAGTTLLQEQGEARRNSGQGRCDARTLTQQTGREHAAE